MRWRNTEHHRKCVCWVQPAAQNGIWLMSALVLKENQIKLIILVGNSVRKCTAERRGDFFFCFMRICNSRTLLLCLVWVQDYVTDFSKMPRGHESQWEQKFVLKISFDLNCIFPAKTNVDRSNIVTSHRHRPWAWFLENGQDNLLVPG